MVSYTMDGIDPDDWEAFKNSYPRSVSIEDVLKRIIGGEHREVTTDEEGRAELGEEYSGEEVRVIIVEKGVNQGYVNIYRGPRSNGTVF